jgi:hypothetical protein
MREAIVPHSKVYVRGLRVSVRAHAFMYVRWERASNSIAAQVDREADETTSSIVRRAMRHDALTRGVW